jgi:hypothetical protein
VLSDHAISLALEGQQRPPNYDDGALRPLDVGCRGGRLWISPGERIGPDTGKIKAEHDGEAGKDQQTAARHQLVSQLSTMVRGLTRP